MASIADLFGRLLVDDSGFEASVVKSAGGAADKASQTMGQKLSGGLKSWAGAGFKAAAGIVATGFAAATAQGLQLNEVLNGLQADTGATGDDWEAMQKVVRRENGRTTESIDEIASATKSMRQDLGLTGESLDKYADKIFDAGLVTKTSATQITGSVDDIVDGFHVGIDRALADLDKLEVSQQKFGGSVQARLDVLPKLAGALLSMNRTEDDGIALLNAAASAGLDATDVQTALTTAVNKFKIPKALKDIVGVQKDHGDKVAFAKDEVQKLEDELAKFVVPERLKAIVKELNGIASPTLRAAAAEKIYNEEVAKLSVDPLQTILDALTAIPDQQGRVTKAQELGLGKSAIAWATLAGKIRDTTGGLDGFKISTEESTGAIEKQADAIDNGPIRSLKLLGERVGAFLADTGSNPLITGIASFGTILGGFAPNLSGKIAGLIGKSFKMAAGSALVTGGVKFAADQAATLYLKALYAGDFVSGALKGLWAKVAGSAVVVAAVQAAGSLAATAYLKALILGDAIGGALSAAWAATGAKVLATSWAQGLAAGGAFSKAFAFAVAAAPILIPVTIAMVVTGDTVPGTPGGAMAPDKYIEMLRRMLAQGRGAEMVSSSENVAQALHRLTGEIIDLGGASKDAAKLGPAINDGLERAAVSVTTSPAIKQLGQSIHKGLSQDVMSAIKEAGMKWAKESRRQANLTAGAWGQGFRERRDAVDQAWQDMLDGLKHPMSVTRETARLFGKLTSEALWKGMHSADPAVKDQAIYTKQLILDRLAELKPRAGTLSADAMRALKRALNSADPDIRTAAQGIYNSIHKPIATLPALGTTAGSSFVTNIIAGMNSQQKALAAAAAGLAGIARDTFQLNSPAKIGPWSKRGGPEGWGRKFSMLLSRGINSLKPDYSAVAGRFELPSMTPRSGQAVPSMAWAPPTAGAAAPPAPIAPREPTINLQTYGTPMYARTPFDIVTQAARGARLGVLTPKRRTAWSPNG